MGDRGGSPPFLLPGPLEGIGLEASQLVGLPGQHLAAIRPVGEMGRSQDRRPLPGSFKQHGSPAAPLPGKNDGQPELPGLVANGDLPPFLSFGETLFDRALGVEIGHIARALGLAQGDQDVPLVPLPVAIHLNTGRALVIGKDLPVTPGVILKSNDVILEKLDFLPPFEDGRFALGIDQFQGGVVVEDFVHPLVAVTLPPPAQDPVEVGENGQPILAEVG